LLANSIAIANIVTRFYCRRKYYNFYQYVKAKQ